MQRYERLTGVPFPQFVLQVEKEVVEEKTFERQHRPM